MFQAGEVGEQCPRRRRSPTENEKELVGPKGWEGSYLSNYGEKKSKFTW